MTLHSKTDGTGRDPAASKKGVGVGAVGGRCGVRLSGGAEMLEVDSDSLRALSSSLVDTADAVASLDPSPPVEAGAAAMPASAFGAAAASSAEPVVAAYRATAARLRQLAEAALASADGYDEAEAAFRHQLLELQGGL